MRTPFSIATACCLFFSGFTYSQDKAPVKFGKICPEDFLIKNLKVDTSEGAVIIADIGSSNFEGNSNGWFTLIYTFHRRVKIFDSKGFDLANVEIPLYISKDGSREEKVEKLKAITYNLEGGKIIETKLSDDAIFREKRSRNYTIRKFSMPAVKPGSIIEYTYTIKSDFLFNLQPWRFQGAFPRLWSEYTVEMPSFFEYISSFQGARNFFIRDQTTESRMFNLRIPSERSFGSDDVLTLTDEVNKFRWVMKDVPPLKEEPFTSSLENYICKIQFQKYAEHFPNQQRKVVMGSWASASKELMEDPSFGAGLASELNWLDADLQTISGSEADTLKKAVKIFGYVQSGIKNLGRAGIYLSKTLKEVFKSKSGYAQEINLLLAAMMRHEGIKASPVVLSTVYNGHINDKYPLLEKLDYVLCMVTINGTDHFLDASQPYLGFGKLAGYCYNGHARAINEDAPILNFSPDTLHEIKSTSLVLLNDEMKPGKWSGHHISQYGNIESGDIRRFMMENGKEAWEKKIRSEYFEEYSIGEIEIDDKNKSNPIRVQYPLTVEPAENSGIIYLNPIINAGYKENPFKSTNRNYPVEMPYLTDRVYILKLQIPAGYEVDELPRSENIILNEGDGVFEYKISKNDKEINLRSELKLEKAAFVPEDYVNLRAFFDHVVKKYAESIVFKKKK
jgi:hypothetical protein